MYGPLMHDSFFGPTASALGFGVVAFSALLLIITLWSLAWKSLALWHAARNRQRLWFIALLLVNTVGILEIMYLAWFQKKDMASGSAHLFPFLAKFEQKLDEASSSSTRTKE